MWKLGYWKIFFKLSVCSVHSLRLHHYREAGVNLALLSSFPFALDHIFLPSHCLPATGSLFKQICGKPEQGAGLGKSSLCRYLGACSISMHMLVLAKESRFTWR